MPAWGRERSTFSLRSIPVIALLAVAAFASSVSADAFNDYEYTRSVSLPSGTSVFDVQPDGRLSAISGLSVYTETAVGSGQFSLQGTLPAADMSYGAAFLRYSPDGSKIAVGNNGSGGSYSVGIFDTTTLAGTWHSLDHYDAEWYDNNSLAVNSGDFTTSQVTLFDTTTLTNTTIISGIQGSSGGVAFDAEGRLYTGNAFGNSTGSNTGDIRAFEQSAWQNALSSSPIDYESSGTVIGEVLSASSLGFDIEGNFHVGGGNAFGGGEGDYVGLIDHNAMDAALAGSGTVDISDAANMRRFDPDAGYDYNFYSINASPINAELFVYDQYSSNTLYVYEVPEPTTAVMLLIGTALGCMRRMKIRVTA